MFSNLGALRNTSYSILSSVSAGGRAYVPVNPNQYVYSQFKYVAGVPAEEGSRGVPLTKLKILNTIIDQLVTMKDSKANAELKGKNLLPEGLDETQIDALIEKYQSEVRSAITGFSNTAYKPPMPEAGTLLSMTA